MNTANNTDHSNYWQALQVRLQELAARYSELGIKPDSVANMRPDDLMGNCNFLNDYHAKNGG